ncbi:MAG: CBS domain-containing protein [Candidatus Bathyarchaeota archaeon]
MSVYKLMTKPVVKIDAYSTVQEAVEKMSREHIGSILVTFQGEDVGIITEKDILSKIIARKANAETIKVKEVMSSPIISVEKNTPGEDALRTMVKHGVRRLPITDKGKIIGIFSTADVTKLAETKPNY